MVRKPPPASRRVNAIVCSPSRGAVERWTYLSRDGWRGRMLIDLRNVYEPEEIVLAGFYYIGVGIGDRAEVQVLSAAE